MITESTMKHCPRCDRFLLKDSFYKSDKTKDRLACWCRRCESDRHKQKYKDNPEKYNKRNNEWYANNKEKKLEQNKEWRESNVSKVRDINLRRRFGITHKDYNSRLEDQGNCCAICKTHKDNFRTFMSVDHCHKTGKIRGIICSNCNSGLGHMKDSEKILSEAIKYLRFHENVDG